MDIESENLLLKQALQHIEGEIQCIPKTINAHDHLDKIVNTINNIVSIINLVNSVIYYQEEDNE